MKKISILIIVLIISFAGYNQNKKGFDADAYYLGVEYVKNENYQEAIESFTRAIKINPDYDEAYLGRGLAKFTQKLF